MPPRNVLAVTLLPALLLGCDGPAEANRLKQALDAVSITITLEPFDTFIPGQVDPGGGLRSVLLYSSPTMHIEPHARYADGKPVSDDAKLTPAALSRLIDDLERSGLLKSADHYHANRAEKPTTPPPAGKKYLDHTRKRPACVIDVIQIRGDWYAYSVCTIPWGKDTVAELKGIIPDALADELLKTCERFP